jgi:DNA-binding NtrC family response regulator
VLTKTKKHLILIADDDRYIRELLHKEFDLSEYEVNIVNNGEKLINLLQTKKASLVITDIYMDDTDGFEVITNVKKLKPNIPIIVITGDNDIELERKVRNKDIFAYFTKPIEIKIFNETIKAAIDGFDKSEALSFDRKH